MKTLLYRVWQCTWGILQTLLGFVMFILHFRCRHYTYHGAVITEWNVKSSMSLGLFVFVTSEPFFAEKFEGQIEKAELSRRLLVHEYGHTIQSLILGPLYLIVIGIPSTLWGFLFGKKRKDEQIPYGAFFTEKWANRLGERVTGEKSIDMLVID
ncbi:MAG: hypothetical protein E7559_06475 [Ruminococcaceae bacterium]|nr:hypothetical protein [Oscillospiraceae bacterium]